MSLLHHPGLPPIGYVAQSLVAPQGMGLTVTDAGKAQAALDAACVEWSQRLAPTTGVPTTRKAGPVLVTSRPAPLDALLAPNAQCDEWLWLPLGNEPGPLVGRYFLHTGTSRMWDAWGTRWCGQSWVPEKNTPRVSCVWRQQHITWSQLGQLVALTGDAPADPPGIVWTLGLTPDHARALQAYEDKHGPGSGAFDVYALRWRRRGRAPREGVAHPFKPRPDHLVTSTPQES